jgi:lysophospholipase
MNAAKSMIYLILVVFSILHTSSALAIPELDFQNNFQENVLPFYEQGQSGTFTAQDGVRIAYRTFEVENEKGALVILPGSGIPVLGYAEFIYDIRELGLSIYVIDHRGQGDSGKIAKDPQVAHVGDFDDYVEDLKQFMDTVVNQKSHSKTFLLGESMGCAIGVQYILKNPSPFTAVILSTPMFGLNTGHLPQCLAHRIAQFGCSLGYGEDYAPSNERYSRRPFATNHLCQSQVRYECAQDVLERNSKLRLGGVSYQWVSTALDAIVAIQTNQVVFDFPLMVFEAGKDAIVRNDAIEQFCEVQGGCKLLKFEDSFHGLLMETDEFRDPAIAEIKNFIQEH